MRNAKSSAHPRRFEELAKEMQVTGLAAGIRGPGVRGRVRSRRERARARCRGRGGRLPAAAGE